jgi:hypothetical protein
MALREKFTTAEIDQIPGGPTSSVLCYVSSHRVPRYSVVEVQRATDSEAGKISAWGPLNETQYDTIVNPAPGYDFCPEDVVPGTLPSSASYPEITGRELNRMAAVLANLVMTTY